MRFLNGGKVTFRKRFYPDTGPAGYYSNRRDWCSSRGLLLEADTRKRLKCRIPHLLRTGTGVVENCYIILKSAFLWCASCRAVVHQRFSRSDRSCSKTQKSSTQVIRFQSFPQKDPDLAGVTPVHNSKSLAEHDQV